MKRRQFIAGLGGVVAWPLVARAQQTSPVLGFLHSGSAAAFAPIVQSMHEALKENGYVEGQNIAIEYRWADNRYDRLAGLAADLVQRRVDVLVAGGVSVSARAAKAATSTIPIVFSTGTDPVTEGLVASLSRPGPNITGVTLYSTTLGAKNLQLLHELVPEAHLVAVLIDQNVPSAAAALRGIQEAASTLHLKLEVVDASTHRDFDRTFSDLVKRGIGALLDDRFHESCRNEGIHLVFLTPI
jgi:putative ABC transport system substrate-binding protein